MYLSLIPKLPAKVLGKRRACLAVIQTTLTPHQFVQRSISQVASADTYRFKIQLTMVLLLNLDYI